MSHSSSRSDRPGPTGRPRAAARPVRNRTPLIVVGGVVAVVVVALVVALAAGGGDNNSTDTETAGTSSPTGGTGSGAGGASTVSVTGTPLPPLTDSANDPAVGAVMPTLSGADLDGKSLTIAPDGHPQMIMFVAHWCPHCRREVPVVQRWVDDGGLPEGVELMSVSTAIDPSLPNYPPKAWLEREHWTAPVLVDGNDSAAEAAGLSAYPFFVATDADGTVVLRTSGELSTDALDEIARTLANGSP